MTESARVGRRAGVILHAGLAATIFLSGCAATQQADTRIAERTAQAVALNKQAPIPAPPVAPVLTRSTEPYFGGAAVRLQRGEPLPAAWEEANAFSLVTPDPMTITAIAARITEKTGIPVRLADGAAQPAGQGMGRRNSTSGGTTSSTTPQGQQGQPGQQPITGGGNQNNPAPLPAQFRLLSEAPMLSAQQVIDTMTASYKGGSLSGFLDQVAARFDLSWEYRGGAIIFSRYQTRTFTIQVLSGQTQASAAVTGMAGSTGGASSGGATTAGAGTAGAGAGGAASGGGVGGLQNLVQNFSLAFYDGLQKTLETLLPPDAVVDVNQTTGTVTLVAPAAAMERAATFLAQENRRMARQVAISLQVLSVDVTDSDSYGVDILAVFEKMGATLSFAGPATGLAQTGLGALGIAILNPPPADAGPTATRFAGSNVAMQAASGSNKIAVDAAFNVLAANNSVVPFRYGTNQDIVTGVSTVSTANVGTTATAQQTTLQTGYTIYVLSRIGDDGQITVWYTFDDTTLQNLTTRNLGTSGNFVDSATVGKRSTVQTATLESGQTLIVAGFDQQTDSANRTGLGSPSNMVTGGGVQAASERHRLVLVLTPVQVSRTGG